MKPAIRMILAVPKADDPTSFYRAYGPLAALGTHLDLRPMMPSAHCWATVALNDICFLQRPADPQCVSIAQQAKISQVPLWVDFDDDNLSVPESNETSGFFNRHDVKDAIIQCARMADVVTVSTEFLKKKYRAYNKNIVVVPNAVDERYLHIRESSIPKRPKDKIIAWRGGPGFLANLEPVIPAIINIAKKYPSWKFIFMGHKPYPITLQIKNYQFIEWLPFLTYMQAICQIHASVFINSVVLNDHSRSRSHGPWLEAAFSGAPLLAPKMDEFNRPGCLNFESPEQFEATLEAIIKKEINVDEMAKLSWDHIQENYMLSKVNKLRVEIMERLLSNDKNYHAVA